MSQFIFVALVFAGGVIVGFVLATMSKDESL
jgi:hypothetical protein